MFTLQNYKKSVSLANIFLKIFCILNFINIYISVYIIFKHFFTLFGCNCTQKGRIPAPPLHDENNLKTFCGYYEERKEVPLTPTRPQPYPVPSVCAATLLALAAPPHPERLVSCRVV